MKLKHNGKYIFFITLIGCVALLSINLTNRDTNKMEEGLSRIIIKPSEVQLLPDTAETTEDGGTPVAITNDSTGVQTMPIPDANAPIIINPLE